MLKYLASPGRAISILKIKNLNKRTMKERVKFPLDLSKFIDLPRRRVRRLNPSENSNRGVRDRTRDIQMITEDEEEKKESGD